MGISGTWGRTVWVEDPSRPVVHTADPAHGDLDVASPIAAQFTAPPVVPADSLLGDTEVYAYDPYSAMPVDTTDYSDMSVGAPFTTFGSDQEYQAARDAAHGHDQGASKATNYNPVDFARTTDAKDRREWLPGMPQVALTPTATNSGHPTASVNHPADYPRGQDDGVFTVDRRFPIGERDHDRRHAPVNTADMVDAPNRITPDGSPGAAARVTPTFSGPSTPADVAVYPAHAEVW